MSVTILANARVLTPAGWLDPGTVRVERARIAAVEASSDRTGDAPSTVDLDGAAVVPGFIDIHSHGGGGGAFPSGDADDARMVAAFHRAHGTTSIVASLVTAPLDDLERSVKTLAPLVSDGTLAGIHLEGPYLSRARCGAHNPSYLRKPDIDEVTRLVDAGEGAIRMITVAPELPDALSLIEHIANAGVIAAVGHSDATYSETRAALAAGARVGTHLYNAMRGLHHREPGAAAALLEHKDVVVELVNDGVHLHDSVVGITFDMVGAARIALVTDAMAAAGMGDGIYPLGPMTVRVAGGIARLVERGSTPGAIAGSTLTMDASVRRAVDDVGISLEAAAESASTTPARVLGIDAEAGSIETGKRADLVVLDDDLAVTRVMRHGRWL